MKKIMCFLLALSLLMLGLAGAMADSAVYTGSARGMQGEVVVNVTIEDGKITDIQYEKYPAKLVEPTICDNKYRFRNCNLLANNVIKKVKTVTNPRPPISIMMRTINWPKKVNSFPMPFA